jgi:hypothetical protein
MGKTQNNIDIILAKQSSTSANIGLNLTEYNNNYPDLNRVIIDSDSCGCLQILKDHYSFYKTANANFKLNNSQIVLHPDFTDYSDFTKWWIDFINSLYVEYNAKLISSNNSQQIVDINFKEHDYTFSYFTNYQLVRTLVTGNVYHKVPALIYELYKNYYNIVKYVKPEFMIALARMILNFSYYLKLKDKYSTNLYCQGITTYDVHSYTQHNININMGAGKGHIVFCSLFPSLVDFTEDLFKKADSKNTFTGTVIDLVKVNREKIAKFQHKLTLDLFSGELTIDSKTFIKLLVFMMNQCSDKAVKSNLIDILIENPKEIEKYSLKTFNLLKKYDKSKQLETV